MFKGTPALSFSFLKFVPLPLFIFKSVTNTTATGWISLCVKINQCFQLAMQLLLSATLPKQVKKDFAVLVFGNGHLLSLAVIVEVPMFSLVNSVQGEVVTSPYRLICSLRLCWSLLVIISRKFDVYFTEFAHARVKHTKRGNVVYQQ